MSAVVRHAPSSVAKGKEGRRGEKRRKRRERERRRRSLQRPKRHPFCSVGRNRHPELRCRRKVSARTSSAAHVTAEIGRKRCCLSFIASPESIVVAAGCRESSVVAACSLATTHAAASIVSTEVGDLRRTAAASASSIHRSSLFRSTAATSRVLFSHRPSIVASVRDIQAKLKKNFGKENFEIKIQGQGPEECVEDVEKANSEGQMVECIEEEIGYGKLKS
nr:probable disease resistance RPP8-like protein 2 [Ipomoea batatas]